MTARRALMELLEVLQEGDRQLTEVAQACGEGSEQRRRLEDRIERALMMRIGHLVRRYESTLLTSVDSDGEIDDAGGESTEPERRRAR